MFNFLKSADKSAQFSGKTHFLNGHAHTDDNGTHYMCIYLFDKRLSGQEQLDNAHNVSNITFPEWTTMTDDERSHDMKQRFKTVRNILEAKTGQDWTHTVA
jgi:hypothetical protein